jgi:mutator protein MutT
MAGAIADPEARILVTRRPEHVHQGGLWEFPGGKLEPGEDPEQGLARELAEELGVRVLASRPLIRIHHDYGDRHILLDVRRVSRYEGVPQGLEGQPLAWLAPGCHGPQGLPRGGPPHHHGPAAPPLLLITGPDPQVPSPSYRAWRRPWRAGSAWFSCAPTRWIPPPSATWPRGPSPCARPPGPGSCSIGTPRRWRASPDTAFTCPPASSRLRGNARDVRRT